MIHEFHLNLNNRITSEKSGLQRCQWRPLLNVYRRFDSQIPVALDCLTLQPSRYNTSKRWWLPTSSINDVRSHKTRVLKNVAVITCNVAIKQYCLLQVLVAALLLVSCAAFEKRYPDPLDCHKYYLRIDNEFLNFTCPNELQFDQNREECNLNVECTFPVIPPLTSNDCSQKINGYYCESSTSFTYCTNDGLKILVNAPCPSGNVCLGPPNTRPCILW